MNKSMARLNNWKIVPYGQELFSIDRIFSDAVICWSAHIISQYQFTGINDSVTANLQSLFESPNLESKFDTTFEFAVSGPVIRW